MRDGEMRQAGEQLLNEAKEIRAAYPDGSTLRELPVRPLPAQAGSSPLAAALRYLRAEMLLVRDGSAGGLGVLDDEIAFTESVLAGR